LAGFQVTIIGRFWVTAEAWIIVQAIRRGWREMLKRLAESLTSAALIAALFTTGWFFYRLLATVPSSVERDALRYLVLQRNHIAPPRIALTQTSNRQDEASRGHHNVLKFNFKASPVFTQSRKDEISAEFERFHSYISSVGFDPPVVVPPIECAGEGSHLALVEGGASVYESKIVVGQAQLDNPRSMLRIWATYMFRQFLRQSPVAGDMELTATLSWIYADYYESSFIDRKNLQRPDDKGGAWLNALWEIRQKYGKDFADRAMFYSFKVLRDRAPSETTASLYFANVFRYGFHVVDNFFEKNTQLLGILRSHGLVSEPTAGRNDD
jgi:hypothetical protein